MKLKFVVAALMFSVATAWAGGIIIQEENDALAFSPSDRDYTQGLLLQYVGDSEEVNGELVRHLYGLRNVFYTPRDITIAEPQPDDRPWAGLTALSYTTWTSKKDEFVVGEWMVGVVGEWSQSEYIQTEFHDLIHNKEPKGWSNQIPNEVVANYTEDHYYRYWKAGKDTGWSADWANILGYSIGTAFDYVKVGGIGRAGWGLPKEYHTGVIMPTLAKENTYSLFLFGGAEGKAVVHNVMLGGSLWQDGPQQDMKNFVVDAKAGVSAAARDLFCTGWEIELTYQQVWRSMEFVDQKDIEQFGGITLGVFMEF